MQVTPLQFVQILKYNFHCDVAVCFYTPSGSEFQETINQSQFENDNVHLTLLKEKQSLDWSNLFLCTTCLKINMKTLKLQFTQEVLHFQLMFCARVGQMCIFTVPPGK